IPKATKVSSRCNLAGRAKKSPAEEPNIPAEKRLKTNPNLVEGAGSLEKFGACRAGGVSGWGREKQNVRRGFPFRKETSKIL
ncbi:MAG: hypothetical protein D6714_19305, partial [Bacteroidetes bacterium]